MKTSRLILLLAVTAALGAHGATPAPKSAPQSEQPLYESTAPAKPECQIDKFVMAKLAPLGIQRVLCSDSVFVRRTYLDIIGTLPTAEEARKFIQDPNAAGKRRALIDELLQRDEFAVYWAMKWSDLLRIKAEFPINLWPNAAQAYHRWVVASLEENKPYDQFARELLTSSGSNFRVGPVNFYRAMQSRTPDGIASTVALTFMGVRTDAWKPEKLAGMARFFAQTGYKPTSEWKEEYVFWDPIGAHTLEANIAPGRASIEEIGKAVGGQTAASAASPISAASADAVFPDGTKIKLTEERDPREVFADWLITPQNPWFARNIANRVWSWLLGRGIIQPADDIRESNPPSNPELLAYLESELVKGKYDLKHLFRLILNSHTYQSSSLLRQTKPEAQAQFASYPLRRMEAEVLIDAINKITGTTELYTSPIPEPFTYIPQGEPAMSIGDGSITSPFLALFGRSARATGTEDERSNKFIPSQWLHLLNSSQIQGKLERGPGLKAIVGVKRTDAETLDGLYLTILSRLPTAAEVENAKAYGQPAGLNKAGKPRTAKRGDDWIDIAWALINSSEFLFRH